MNIESEPQELLTQAKQVLEKHREALLSKANVVGVGVGLKQTSGLYTKTVALIVLVTHKMPLGKLTEEDMVPNEIEGFPVDIQETGHLSTG
ncbi:MAG: hypothetical protein IT308_01275 [Anaerolineaceae bacterium]|nr:hypothetical protein [Anaerolineaceae bacterium]